MVRLGNMRAQQLRASGTPGPQESILKLAGALHSQSALSLAVELQGPAGMLISGYDEPMTRTDVSRLFLRSQAATIAGGTSEILRNLLGERALGLPGEPRADKGLAWSEISMSSN